MAEIDPESLERIAAGSFEAILRLVKTAKPFRKHFLPLK